MPKYSIITPLYNSFDLMSKYFESLERQTYKDFEVIIVDDCSTDNSYENVLDYAKKSDLDISVYKTEGNGGPGRARNLGIEKASGEWITFIDNDDWVEFNLIEEIEKVLKENQVHCVIYDYYIQRENENQAAHSMYCGEQGVVSMSECMSYVRNHSIGKFYKLENCNQGNIRFPDLRRCEDVAFVARAIDACGSAYYLKKPLYHYVQRKTSLSNNLTLDESDMVKAFEIIENSLSNKYPNEIKEKSVTDLLYGSVLMMCKAKKSTKSIKKFISEYSKKYAGWHKCKIIKTLGKAKRIFLILIRHKFVCLLRLLSSIHTKMIG